MTGWTTGEFRAALTDEERQDLRELAEAFGPLKFQEAWCNEEGDR